MKKFIYFFMLLLLCACNKQTPTETIINEPVIKDTLTREILEGVYLFVDSLKDVYSLDEYVFANVHLKNENNPSGLPIYIGSWPPFLFWKFENSLGEKVDFGPLVVGGAVYDDTLKVGEEIVEDIKWYHYVWDENEMHNGLKAFTGDYILKIDFMRIEYGNYPHLIKYFSISEVGDPLSHHLFRDYDSEDTVKIDFILRNRINSQIELNTTSDSCAIYLIEEIYNQEPDTVFTHKFLLEQSTYNLESLSDNIIYEFRYLEQDFINQGIWGAFDIVIKLNFVERIIISNNLIFIL